MTIYPAQHPPVRQSIELRHPHRSAQLCQSSKRFSPLLTRLDLRDLLDLSHTSQMGLDLGLRLLRRSLRSQALLQFRGKLLDLLVGKLQLTVEN